MNCRAQLFNKVPLWYWLIWGLLSVGCLYGRAADAWLPLVLLSLWLLLIAARDWQSCVVEHCWFLLAIIGYLVCSYFSLSPAPGFSGFLRTLIFVQLPNFILGYLFIDLLTNLLHRLSPSYRGVPLQGLNSVILSYLLLAGLSLVAMFSLLPIITDLVTHWGDRLPLTLIVLIPLTVSALGGVAVVF